MKLNKQQFFFLIIWAGLILISSFYLISHRSPLPYLYFYSKRYIVFLMLYFSGTVLIMLSEFNIKKIKNITKVSGILLIAVTCIYIIYFNFFISEQNRGLKYFFFVFSVQLFFLIGFYINNSKYKTIFHNFLLYFSIVTVSLIIALKGFDIYLHISPTSTSLPGVDLQNVEKTIQTLELFPYTGWHIPSNLHHKGKLLLEQSYPDFDYKSGPMGFFMEFDPESPPEKKSNEFRIILIGGSGAQGFGAQKNDYMLYKQLEKQLNKKLSPKGIMIRIINMAMASSVTYQNFISLNRWGHNLEPDLILSYSGRNDFVVPMYHEPLTDGYYYFTNLNALSIACRNSESPPGLMWLKKFYPNIMGKTNIGFSAKLLLSNNYFVSKAMESYKENRGIDSNLSKKQFLEKIVIPLYIHSFKSIKRDFEGIPIMIAWQAMSPSELQIYKYHFGFNNDSFYNEIFEKAQYELNDYVNQDWYYINIHKLFEKDPKPYISTHLGNEGHQIVAEKIADELCGITEMLYFRKIKTPDSELKSENFNDFPEMTVCRRGFERSRSKKFCGLIRHCD